MSDRDDTRAVRPRRLRLAAIVLALVIAIAGLSATPAPEAAADTDDPGTSQLLETVDWIEVYRAGVCGPMVGYGWFVTSDALGGAGGLAAWLHRARLGLIIAAGGIVNPATLAVSLMIATMAAIISAVSNLAAFLTCTDTIAIPVLRLMIEQAASQSGETVERTFLDELDTQTDGILALVLEKRDLLLAWQAGDLEPEESYDLSTEIEILASEAELALQTIADNRSWMSLPVIPTLSGIVTSGYALAAAMAAPGGLRQGNLLRLVERKRQQELQLMRTKEDEFRSRLAGIELYRHLTAWSSKDYSYRPHSWRAAATVKRPSYGTNQTTGSVVFNTTLECMKYDGIFPTPNQKPGDACYRDAVTSWKPEILFTQAYDAYRSTRAQMMQAIDIGYLHNKAVAGYHATFGADAERSFFLINNRSRSGPDTCVGVAGGDSNGVGAHLVTAPCTFDTLDPAGVSLVWDYVPGTALLRHIRTGLCVDGPSKAAGGASQPVTLTACPPSEQSSTDGFDRRDWGIHPAGYLVHLRTEQCLDPEGMDQVGATLLVGPCRYDLPSRRGGLDAPKEPSIHHGTLESWIRSVQLTAGPADGRNWATYVHKRGSLYWDRSTDPQTDQVWHVRPATARVRVVASGDPGVRVRSIPAGIDCGTVGGAGCHADFEIGTPIRLEAVLDGHEGAGRARWDGECTASDVAACSFEVVAGARAGQPYDPNLVTARLDRVRSIAVATAGGRGSVAISPAADELAVACATGECTGWYEQGTEVTVTAEPDEGYVFAGWTGACAGQGLTCAVTVTNLSYRTTALFAPRGWGVVSVAKSGTGAGRVEATLPDGIDCGSTCTAEARLGSEVVLDAVPAAGHWFAGWAGACSGSGSRCEVTVAALTEVTAEFVAPVVKTTPRVRVRPTNRRVRAGWIARFAVAVDADGVQPTGQVTVRVAGARRTVRLTGAGAMVRVRVPRTTRPGWIRVVAAYRGDDRVQPGRATTHLRITR